MAWSLTDPHVWRLGPAHLAAILSVATRSYREPRFYSDRLAKAPSSSHVTVEVDRTFYEGAAI
jgi:Co/Zn/Cd efflux system component